jgi:acyl-CoA hydrolase
MKYITSTLVRPVDIGLNGNLFGGALLTWLDGYGGIYLYKCLRHKFVTYKMEDIYFLKSAKVDDLIDFYVDNLKFNKISVDFNIIAKINESGKEIINTKITFVAVNPETAKPVQLNPFKFERAEFEQFVKQKLSKESFNIKIAWPGSLEHYKKKYLVEAYFDIYKEKTETILKIQRDWGKILEPNVITDIIGMINKQGENNE